MAITAEAMRVARNYMDAAWGKTPKGIKRRFQVESGYNALALAEFLRGVQIPVENAEAVRMMELLGYTRLMGNWFVSRAHTDTQAHTGMQAHTDTHVTTPVYGHEHAEAKENISSAHTDTDTQSHVLKEEAHASAHTGVVTCVYESNCPNKFCPIHSPWDADDAE